MTRSEDCHNLFCLLLLRIKMARFFHKSPRSLNFGTSSLMWFYLNNQNSQNSVSILHTNTTDFLPSDCLSVNYTSVRIIQLTKNYRKILRLTYIFPAAATRCFWKMFIWDDVNMENLKSLLKYDHLRWTEKSHV